MRIAQFTDAEFVPKLLSMLRRQDSLLGVATAWLLGPLWGFMGCFYLGTIWSQVPMTTDLTVDRIYFGLRWGLIGLLIGIAFALVVTIVYPRAIEREAIAEAEHDDHH